MASVLTHVLPSNAGPCHFAHCLPHVLRQISPTWVSETSAEMTIPYGRIHSNTIQSVSVRVCVCARARVFLVMLVYGFPFTTIYCIHEKILALETAWCFSSSLVDLSGRRESSLLKLFYMCLLIIVYLFFQCNFNSTHLSEGPFPLEH